MNPRVIDVKPNTEYLTGLDFNNGKVNTFDVTPYLSKGIFSELKDKALFNSAKVFNGTVVWENELDFCPDTLYLESVKQ